MNLDGGEISGDMSDFSDIIAQGTYLVIFDSDEALPNCTACDCTLETNGDSNWCSISTYVGCCSTCASSVYYSESNKCSISPTKNSGWTVTVMIDSIEVISVTHNIVHENGGFYPLPYSTDSGNTSLELINRLNYTSILHLMFYIMFTVDIMFYLALHGLHHALYLVLLVHKKVMMIVHGPIAMLIHVQTMVDHQHAHQPLVHALPALMDITHSYKHVFHFHYHTIVKASLILMQTLCIIMILQNGIINIHIHILIVLELLLKVIVQHILTHTILNLVE